MTTKVISILAFTLLLLGVTVNGQSSYNVLQKQLQQQQQLQRHFERSLPDFMRCARIGELSLAFLSRNKGAQYVKTYYGGQSGDTRGAMCIGGATQAFTAVLLAKLIDENENVTWDTPIQDIVDRRVVMPDFYRSNNLNLKDILAMRSGLTGMDIVSVTKPFSVRRLIRNLRYAPVVAGFRDKFVYNEVLFALIEDVVSALTGDTWKNALKKHILEPLDMMNTVFVGEDSREVDVIKGMVYINKRPYRLSQESYSGLELVAPAASLCTSAEDMMKWMKFLLYKNQGNDQSEVVRREALEMTFNAIQSRGDGGPEIEGYSHQQVSYARDQNALGWIKGNFRGLSFISQDGSLPGYQSLTTIVPSEDIAVHVAFTGDQTPKSFAAKVLLNIIAMDMVNGSQHWFTNVNLCNMLNAMEQQHMEKEDDRHAHIVRTYDSGFRELDSYAKSYRNFAFGDVNVVYNESRDYPLTMEYGTAEYRLSSTNVNDTFQMIALGGPLFYSTNADIYKPLYAEFSTDPRNPDRIKSVTIAGFDKNVDPVFSRNARAPRYEEDPRYGAKCSATNSVISMWSILLLAVMAYLR